MKQSLDSGVSNTIASLSLSLSLSVVFCQYGRFPSSLTPACSVLYQHLHFFISSSSVILVASTPRPISHQPKLMHLTEARLFIKFLAGASLLMSFH